VSAEISQQLVSAGVTQHVRMDAKWHLGGLSETLVRRRLLEELTRIAPGHRR